jgi:uncharacterized integral membrane protein
MKAYLLCALAFIAVIVIFITQNDTQVSVQFINWKTSEISLAVVVLISVFAGGLITFLLDSYRAFKTGQKMRKLMKSNQKYEEEILVLKGKQPGSKDSVQNQKSDTGQTP